MVTPVLSSPYRSIPYNPITNPQKPDTPLQRAIDKAKNNNTPSTQPTSSRPRNNNSGGGSSSNNQPQSRIETYNVAEDTNKISPSKSFQPQSITEQAKNFITLQAQAQQNQTGNFGDKYISLPPNANQNFADRIKNFFSFGTRANKLVVPLGSYDVGGYASPTRSGKGTIESGFTTQLDRNKQEIAIKQAMIDIVQNKIINSEINKGNTDVEDIKSKISNSSEYDKAVKDYQKTASKLGFQEDAFGKLVNPELEKNKYDIRKENLRTAGIATAGVIAPELTAATLIGANQNQKQAIVNSQGNIIGYKENLRTVANDVANLLVVAGGTGIALRNVVRGTNEAIALDALNNKIAMGEYKFDQEALQTGKIKVAIKDIDSGKQILQEVDIGTQQANNINKQIIRKENAIRNLGLPKETNVHIVGSIEEKNLIQDQIANELPQYSQTIKNSEVGKYTRLLSNGKVEEGYIVRAVNQNQQGGQALNFVFKTTDSGNIKNLRIIKQDLSSGESILARQARPSELPEPKQLTFSAESPALEQFPIDRLKVLKVLKSASKNVNVATSENLNNIIRRTQTKSVTAEIGNIPETISYEQLLQYPNKESNLAVKLKNPIPISTGESQRIEFLNAPKDINEIEYIDIFTIEKNLGNVRKGFSIEKSLIKEIPKPVEYEKVNIQKSTMSNEVSEFNAKQIEKILNPKTESAKINSGNQQLENDLKSIEKNFASSDLGSAFPKQKLPKISKAKLKTSQLPELELDLKKAKSNTKSLSLDITKGKNNIKNAISEFDLLKDTGITLTRINNSSKTKVNAKQNIDISQIQKQIQEPRLNQPQIQQPRFKIPNQPKLKIPDLIGLDFPNKSNKDNGSGDKELNKLMRKRGRRKGKYTSSLGAAAFQEKPIKVSKKEFKRLSEATYSGIETRPLLELSSDQKKIKKGLKSVRF